MAHQNRVTELRMVRAGDLIPDKRNWRQHPKAQQDAMKSILDEVGYADAVIVRETDEGLMLIDGHLRADLDPEQIIPALVTDLDYDEAGVVLATMDPLAAMAEANVSALEELVEAAPVDLSDIVDRYMPPPDLLGEWTDMPDFSNPGEAVHLKISVTFQDEAAVTEFCQKLGIPRKRLDHGSKFLHYPDRQDTTANEEYRSAE